MTNQWCTCGLFSYSYVHILFKISTSFHPFVRFFIYNQSESTSVARSVVCLFSQLVGRSIGQMDGRSFCLVRQLVSRPAIGQSKIRSATNDQTVGQLDSQVVRQLNRQMETNEVR